MTSTTDPSGWRLSPKTGMPVNSGYDSAIPAERCSALQSAHDVYVQYDDATAKALAEEILRDATKETCIAIVSAPSVFIQVKNILVSLTSSSSKA